MLQDNIWPELLSVQPKCLPTHYILTCSPETYIAELGTPQSSPYLHVQLTYHSRHGCNAGLCLCELRYSCHSHKSRRPVVFHGLAVASTAPATLPLPRHGLVCHDSHCTATNNTVVGCSGSCVFGEDGTETGTTCVCVCSVCVLYFKHVNVFCTWRGGGGGGFSNKLVVEVFPTHIPLVPPTNYHLRVKACQQ